MEVYLWCNECPSLGFFVEGIILDFLVGVGSVIHTALYPFPFAKKLLVDTFVIREQIAGLPVERVNACWRLRLPGSLSSSKVLVSMALPSPASPPPVLSGSGSPPAPCQAVSALLTGNKTNLAIKSEYFFFPGICAERAQWWADWQGREGRSAQLEVGWWQLQPEPL